MKAALTKPTKPSAPYVPSMPSPPVKELETWHTETWDIEGSLWSLLSSRVASHGDRISMADLERIASGLVIHSEQDYGESSCSYTLRQMTLRPNRDYDKQMKSYEKALLKYEQKLKDYQKNKVEYQVKLKAWQEYCDTLTTEAELKQLETLKKKYEKGLKPKSK